MIFNQYLGTRTVDHEILLERLRVTLDVGSSALAWFWSYLAGRTQRIRCDGKCSTSIDIDCGIPQGSVLGPILFIVYTADLAPIVAKHGLLLHQYTAKFTVLVGLPPLLLCRLTSNNVLTPSPAGCGRTA